MSVEDDKVRLLCGLNKMEKQEEKIQEKENNAPSKNINEVLKIDEALKKLRSLDKRKFDQTLDLIINLQKFDNRKDALNSYIQIPVRYERKIAAFLTTNVKGVDVIKKDTFESYKTLRDAKRLAKKYDMFISAAPLMGQVATKFGRALGPSGKMPSPQLGIIVKEDESTIKDLVEKMQKSIRVRTKEKVIKIGIGKESMSDSELKQNIESAIKSSIDLLPQKKDNVKDVLIKFTMTPPVKIDYDN